MMFTKKSIKCTWIFIECFSDKNSNIYNISKDNFNELMIIILNIVYINSFGVKYPILFDDLNILGLCLYTKTSLFNHSCCPNAFYYFKDGNNIVVKTLKPIKKNEAISISIIYDIQCKSKNIRQEILKNNFGFNCLCQRCNNNACKFSTCL